jgi:hypothetical protein
MVALIERDRLVRPVHVLQKCGFRGIDLSVSEFLGSVGFTRAEDHVDRLDVWQEGLVCFSVHDGPSAATT